MADTNIKYHNHLITENSPYLLQHAHNPVNWYPWGEEAFSKARNENKLVLVSIGYAACHWCHVMEHESFEDEGVASIMNENFVCIKVDREERPDIDHVYMDAVQLLTHRGGWPLNCFVLPDGRPVFGGTYFPKENWKEVLQSLKDVYKSDPDKVLEQAESIVTGLSDISPFFHKEDNTTFNVGFINRYYESLSETFDPKWGGNKGAPKFPMPVVYEFVLSYYYHSGYSNALESLILVLDKMALGGIYDHLGGGFARYSTDEQWLVPHFEKMLYDNAQLVSLYSKAYKITKKEAYKDVITDTLRFVERELTSPYGAFYSSVDADSEGEEGKFYVWTKKEIDEVLEEQSDIFNRYYHISTRGNWEHGKNIPFLDTFPESPVKEALKRSKELLFRRRGTRIRPSLDSKILCSWNALMLEAYLEAYTALGDGSYFEKALTIALYLEKHHFLNGKVMRVNQNNKTIQGFLDDYSYTTKAFLRLYQVSCDEKWLHISKQIIDYAIDNFLDQNTGMFYFTSGEDSPLAVRKIDLNDNVTPASNSVMASVLHLLGRYFDNSSYIQMSQSMSQAISSGAIQYAWYHAGWAKLFCDFAYPSFEVVIAGPNARQMVADVERHYNPGILICGSAFESNLPLLQYRFKADDTWIYFCSNNTCQMPVRSLEKLMTMINEAN